VKWKLNGAPRLDAKESGGGKHETSGSKDRERLDPERGLVLSLRG